MPQVTLALLDRKWSHVALPRGHICFAPGDVIQRVYFPTSGLISLVVSTEKGEFAEAGMVGREGAVGLQSALGPRISYTRTIVQVAGMSYSIAADALREAIHRSEEAQALVIHYNEMLLAEAQQLAACNAVHDASSRLARWLLQCADRIGSERLPLTQEFLGEMLGVKRTSVTLLAQNLHARGMIKYSRGRITIADRTALESWACECYRAIKELYRAFPGGPLTSLPSR
jgi:CRP-like cAMP-binding protein